LRKAAADGAGGVARGRLGVVPSWPNGGRKPRVRQSSIGFRWDSPNLRATADPTALQPRRSVALSSDALASGTGSLWPRAIGARGGSRNEHPSTRSNGSRGGSHFSRPHLGYGTAPA
jgi:hypothetical protein